MFIFYFLLLKKIESKIYLSNFTLGEYKIITVGEKKYYRSAVFPYHPQIGLISKEKMKNLLAQKNSVVLKNSFIPVSPIQQNPKIHQANTKAPVAEKMRAPANEESSFFSMIASGLLVFLILIITVFMRKIKKP